MTSTATDISRNANMRNQIVLAFTFLVFLAAMPVAAADAPPFPSKPGAKADEFRALHKEMQDIIAKLATLRIAYGTANEDKRADIQQKYKDLIVKGTKIETQLIDAAEKAYQEAPNTDKEIVEFLVRVMYEKIDADDYEPAAKIGKLLVDNKCNVKGIANLAGIATFATSDFSTAEKYLTLADNQGYYKSAPKEDELAKVGEFYLRTIPYYKKAWAKEKLFRAREAKANDLPRVLLKTTKGDIELELFEDQAPNTVANFITLVRSGFYKNVAFHRVLKGFMAQGGDPKGDGSGGPGYTIPDECRRSDHREHFRGTLSMAKTQLPDSGGSQFFLCFVPTPQLDGKHTVFGRVVKGMDVLAKIQRRNPDDPEAPRPDKILDAKVIKSIRKPASEYKAQKMPD
jgi:cyclophilin family peptidyl-prolyl cis-trans isomerase